MKQRDYYALEKFRLACISRVYYGDEDIEVLIAFYEVKSEEEIEELFSILKEHRPEAYRNIMSGSGRRTKMTISEEMIWKERMSVAFKNIVLDGHKVTIERLREIADELAKGTKSV